MSSHLAGTFAQQSTACRRLGSTMYAELLAAMAQDIDAGGPTLTLLSAHEDDPGPSALALRLLAPLHALVLRGELPELATYYPSVGGSWSLEGARPHVLDALVKWRDHIGLALDRAPQTNEVGRSAALLGGLLHIADRFDLPVRLLELGASAGLNLRADRFRYGHRDGWWGPPGSTVALGDAWRGPPPPLDVSLTVIERRGVDVAPIDPSTPGGPVVLTSYVWPDMPARLARLRGALEVAREVPAEVAAMDAVAAVEELDLRPRTTTVVWHSVMWQYLSADQRDAITDRLAALGRASTQTSPLAHLSLEPTRRNPAADHEFLVVLHTWPDDQRRVLGTATPHGVPTTWE